MRSTSLRTPLILGGLAVAASLSACGGGGGGGGGTPAATPSSTLGTLSVAMTDAPACGFDAVNVTVAKVRVNKSATASETDSGWTDITLAAPKKVNLLDLTNGVLETLGQTSLEAGQYNQIRLVLDGGANANTVVPSATKTEQALETPSALQSGIKLVGNFTVEAGAKSDVVIDFDACKSVVARGKSAYALKPVVKMIPAAINGISGFVAPALLANGVTVSAQQNGNIVSATTPNASTGEFLLSRLAPGNYDVVITANNSAAVVVGAVPVASTTSNTALSTAAAPITLAASTTGSIGGTVTMTPPSTTEAAYVAAKQSFASGPTVTIKYQGADLATGAYTIANLPVAAPQYAVYSATLPLSFAASAGLSAGSYRVDASATGYTAKSVDGVNIATANATGVNFTLTP
ncbi:DUF4382 domain-containing protein [Massilia sp. Mn16-1_5]|uniref:DUF4382 domain-containing protein n=1 Tax=Massilia sp. Mn16-1_5 TaxID=2079199 RepID=UPI00109E5F5F|nr:DUF4382 domain-containing protein [Massilia sp. Mn16-1_5]THC43245.1 hypothetical protein C2862_13450 [Massilia sp. Mn16-1_5]